GEVPAAAGEYEIIYGNYDKDVIGEYTVTVKMTAAYYGNDVVVTDTLLVKVEEEADYSAAKITVDAATLSIGYKLSFDFPEATALGTASDGTTADITDDIRITVEHNNGTIWYIVEGYDGVPLSGSTKSFAPDWHGYYRVTYTVSYAGKTDSVTIAMNVQDTLQGVKAEVPAGKVYVHQSDDLDLSGVTVKKVLSYTNENVAGEGEYTVDYGGYEKGCELGDYVVTVRMTASYYGNEVVKEDTFTLTVIADGEEIDYSSAKITVEGTEVYVGYGIPYTFPDVIAEGKNKDGVSADIHDAVKVSLQYGTSNGVETFWNDVEGHANLAISEESRTFTADMHGYYRMKYEVTYSGVTATAYFNANIADTLISISLNTDAVTGKIHKGDALNLANLEVWAVLSYSGETRLADNLYTVDFGTLTEESDVGEYTLTVIVEQVLANVTIRKEATFTVNVVPDSEEINYSSVKIYLETAEANISYRLPYTVPDVTVKATDKDGNAVEVYSDVKITIQHGESDGTVMTWSDVAGYVDLAISEESRTFTPEMHGYYRVVYSIEYAGITDTVYFRINIMDTLQGIRIDASNVNTSIHKGEEFDTSRLSVIGTRSYTGDFSVAEGAYSVDFGGLDTSVPGEYTVTITYGEVFGGEFTTSFTVTVKDIVTSFTVTSYPTRNTFAYGEVFDMNGFAATVVFETLGEREVASSEVEISGYSARKVGKQTVTFTYDGVVGGTMEVTVSDAFYAIVINIDDVKLTYKKGEALDLSGLAVYKVMVSGSRSELNSDGYTVDTSAFENKEGVYTIIVSATVDGVTKSASFEVEVQAGSGCGGCGGDLGANAVMFAAVTLLAGVMLKKKNG
ncbi:MAG: bacterial Ig-like domain-containing protein, partial [Clostridia bacterium]|nr:bacterial Ig-like domain-containing protein [Clostridia bacterium]